MVKTRYPSETGWGLRSISLYKEANTDIWVDDVFIGGANTTEFVDGRCD